MSSRILYVLWAAMAVTACIPPGQVGRASPASVVLGRCISIDREGRLLKLDVSYEQWIRSCEQVFGAANSPELSKQRVGLALEFRNDGGLQDSVQPLTWKELKLAVQPDVEALAQATQDGEGLVLLARWDMDVLGENNGAQKLACKAAQVAPELFDGQLLCGDYLHSVSQDVMEAEKRWGAAFPLAHTHEQQCDVVERFIERGLNPDRYFAQMPPTAVEDCKEKRQFRRQQDLAERMRQAARELQNAADALIKARSTPPTATADPQK